VPHALIAARRLGARRLVLPVLGGVLVALLYWTRACTAIPETYYMTGPSMVPAVGQGAWFLARPIRGALARGDLVIVQMTLDDSLYDVLRRVVGLPGDTLAMTGGILAVNGRPAPWPFRVIEPRAVRALDGPIPGTTLDWGPITVGRDSVFVLSDTRDMLGWPDSRFLGAFPRAAVTARHALTLVRGRPAVP
jgi:signal peptidase I